MDGLVVVARLVVGVSIAEPFSKVSKSIKDIVDVFNESEVGEGTTLAKVGLVDEVPASLEGVALTLNVVSEGSAFGQGVVVLTASKGGVGGLKDCVLCKSGFVG